MAKMNKNWVRAVGDALSMATSFAAAVALGYFAGQYLDGRFHTEPYLMLLMLLIGVATGFKIMYDQAFGKKSLKMSSGTDDEEESRKRFNPSQEAIDAISEAKKMIAGLDAEKKKPADDKPKDD
ncbi:MAG: AtpZ/AtpI family protein [Ignavibacteriales bacterium]